MPIDDKAVRQYLAKYAEPEILAAGRCGLTGYRRCIVIPAYRETWPDVRHALAGITDSCLLILVVNAPGHDAATTQLLHEVRTSFEVISRSGNVEYLRTALPFDILLIDRCSEGQTIGRPQGVGLARKIGTDVALALMDGQAIDTGFVYCTDADVRLPPDYFRHEEMTADTAAIVYPFVHVAEPGYEDATLLYEISMLYYVAGLAHAGSPYAFPTIGSTLAISAMHYARVRGFPRRNAGEDFYLLNKLAKSGGIIRLTAPVIRVSARLSDRVPFGTGVGIGRIAALAEPATEPLFYNPEIFELLGQFLALLGRAFDTGPISAQCPDPVTRWAIEHDIDEVIAARRARGTSRAVFERAMHDWFDGFRTLKFVHYLRDHGLSSVPLAAIARSTLVAEPQPASLQAIRDRLARRCFP